MVLGQAPHPVHIVTESDSPGVASVRNGLTLCKIRHVVFESCIPGVRPGRAAREARPAGRAVEKPPPRLRGSARNQQTIVAQSLEHAVLRARGSSTEA